MLINIYSSKYSRIDWLSIEIGSYLEEGNWISFEGLVIFELFFTHTKDFTIGRDFIEAG